MLNYQKTKLNDLSYGIKSGQIFLLFCHNARVWQTDRRTDIFLVAIPSWHSVQRGKKYVFKNFKCLAVNVMNFLFPGESQVYCTFSY